MGIALMANPDWAPCATRWVQGRPRGAVSTFIDAEQRMTPDAETPGFKRRRVHNAVVDAVPSRLARLRQLSVKKAIGH